MTYLSIKYMEDQKAHQAECLPGDDSTCFGTQGPEIRGEWYSVLANMAAVVVPYLDDSVQFFHGVTEYQQHKLSTSAKPWDADTFVDGATPYFRFDVNKVVITEQGCAVFNCQGEEHHNREVEGIAANRAQIMKTPTMDSLSDAWATSNCGTGVCEIVLAAYRAVREGG